MPYNRLWRAAEATLDAPLRARKAWRWRLDGDLFHESVPDAWIDQVFAVMALAPQHTFQVLTKRAGRMREYVSDPATPGRIARVLIDACVIEKSWAFDAATWPVITIGDIEDPDDVTVAWPRPNIWKGVSAEDQTRADERTPDLLATPAAVRFLSAEPMLGPLDLTRIPTMLWRDAEQVNALTGMLEGMFGDPAGRLPHRLDLVIAGGESGPRARDVETAAFESLRDQCASAGVAFFMKQMPRKSSIPAHLQVREFPNV